MPNIQQQAPLRTCREEERNGSIDRMHVLNICEGEDMDNQLPDEIDSLVGRDRVTCYAFLFPVVGILSHFFDVGSDIYLAIKYFCDEKILYGIGTITFVYFPIFVNMSINLRMFTREKIHGQTMNAVAWKRNPWSRVLIHVFHLAPIVYNSYSLRYAWKSKKFENAGKQSEQQHYYRKVVLENEEFALFGIFDAFLEAAPQLILQLTILLSNNDKTAFPPWYQIVSLCTSLINMGLTLMRYHRNIRLAQQDKREISICGSICQFLWHFSIIVSRIISISIVASKWPLYTVLCCLVHWAAMTIWLIFEPHGITEFCANYTNALTPVDRCRSGLFATVLGIVYIFAHLNIRDGSTFIRHCVYYPICGVENLAAVILWVVASNESVKSSWYFELLIILCIVPFCLGVLFMILYYAYFHPTLNCQTSSSKRVLPQIGCTTYLLGFLSTFVLCHFT